MCHQLSTSASFHVTFILLSLYVLSFMILHFPYFPYNPCMIFEEYWRKYLYPISFFTIRLQMVISGYKWLYPDTCYLYLITHHSHMYSYLILLLLSCGCEGVQSTVLGDPQLFPSSSLVALFVTLVCVKSVEVKVQW